MTTEQNPANTARADSACQCERCARARHKDLISALTGSGVMAELHVIRLDKDDPDPMATIKAAIKQVVLGKEEDRPVKQAPQMPDQASEPNVQKSSLPDNVQEAAALLLERLVINWVLAQPETKALAPILSGVAYNGHSIRVQFVNVWLPAEHALAPIIDRLNAYVECAVKTLDQTLHGLN